MKKARYLPMLLIIVYLIASYIMYRFGCYIWPFRDDMRTFYFIILVIIAFGIGYALAVEICSKNLKQNENRFIAISSENILKVCCLISIIVYVPICITYTNSWYPPFFKVLTDPKGVYYTLAEVVKNRNGVRIWAFFDVFPYMIMPLVLYDWEKISVKIRLASVALSVGYLMIYISSGRNISVVVQMLSVVAAWLGVVFGKRTNSYKKSVIRTSILALMYCIIVVFFFNLTISARMGYTEEIAEELEHITEENISKEDIPKEDIFIHEEGNVTIEKDSLDDENEEYIDEFAIMMKDWNAEAAGQYVGVGCYEYNGLEITQEQNEKFNQVYKVFPNYTDIWSKAYVDSENLIMQYLPSGLKNLYVMITSYITNGYNCLTVALHTDHQWTYGVGHSTFLSSYIDAIFGTNITQKTYYSRLTNDKEYPLISKSLWPSMFVQLADDLTFFGVIIFMAILGFVIARVWISVISEANFFGVALLGQFELLIFFLPANNILGNSGGFFVTFWALFLVWLITQIPISKIFGKK